MPRDSADPARNLALLVEVASELGSTFELRPLLERIEQAGRSALNCDRATIFLYDPQREELFSTIATGTGEIRFPARLGIAGEAARTAAVIHVPDAYADPRFNPEIDRRTGYRTRNLLTLPLVAPGGELMGVLQVLNKLDGEFTENDLLLAGALGSLTGVAIKRQMLLDESAARQRLEHDLSIARDIQQQLLPKEDPQLDGFDIAGWNRPADQTGGDLYGFMRPDADRVGFMIADASGHGIGPALVVAQCRALLRAIITSIDVRAADPRTRLAFVTSRVNDLLCDDIPEGRFVTACFGSVHAASRQIFYASAGHGPLVICRAGGATESLAATGLPLGVMKDVPVEAPEPIQLRPGDIFVLATDGFIEWAGPDDEAYGEPRLCSFVHAHRGLPCREIIRGLYDDVQRFTQGTPQIDDLTIILIKCM